MEDYIKRSDGIDFIKSLVSTMSVCVSVDECAGMKSMQKRAIGALRDVPAADVVEVVHGEWIGDCKAISDADGIARCGMYGFRCSKCNGFSIEDGRYCPRCGAKMDGGDHDA